MNAPSKTRQEFDKLSEILNYVNNENRAANFFFDITKNHIRSLPCLFHVDLCCGDGGLITLMQQAGFNCMGVDISSEMLELASRNNPCVEFVRQDASKWRASSRAGVITCYNNSLNYLAEGADLQRLFSNVSLSLCKEGVFLFDIMNPAFMKDIGDSSLSKPVYIDGKELKCENTYNRRVLASDFILDGTHIATLEAYVHLEEEIYDLLKHAPLQLVEKTGYSMVNHEFSNESSHLLFVTKPSRDSQS